MIRHGYAVDDMGYSWLMRLIESDARISAFLSTSLK